MLDEGVPDVAVRAHPAAHVSRGNDSAEGVVLVVGSDPVGSGRAHEVAAAVVLERVCRAGGRFDAGGPTEEVELVLVGRARRVGMASHVAVRVVLARFRAAVRPGDALAQTALVELVGDAFAVATRLLNEATPREAPLRATAGNRDVDDVIVAVVCEAHRDPRSGGFDDPTDRIVGATEAASVAFDVRNELTERVVAEHRC